MSVEDGNKPAPRPEAAAPKPLISDGMLERLINSGLAQRGKLQLMPAEHLIIPPEKCSSQKLGSKTQAADPVNHPSHYTSHPAKCGCGAPIECIQITEHMSFNLGNATKYLWRADLKGAALQDLEKAKWYISREIEKRKKEGA